MFEYTHYTDRHDTYSIPEKIMIIENGKVYKGSSKEIILTALKTKEGYYLNFYNPHFVNKLLNENTENIINKMLEINSMNIDKTDKNTLNGKIFEEEILGIKDNFKVMNTYLFVFIYYWFTDLPVCYINTIIEEFPDESKRKYIVSNNLRFINEINLEKYDNGRNKNHKYEYIKSRDDENISYQDFKYWLNNKYINGIMNIRYFINNESLTYKINEKGDKIYSIDDKQCILEEIDPNLVVINQEDLKAMPYKEYLQTQHWINTREMALIRANYECQLCRSEYRLQVHHNTYKNIGNEKDEDLIVLCEKCHKKHHGKKYK